MYLVYVCKTYSVKYDGNNANLWKSTGINKYPKNSNVTGVSVATLDLPVFFDNGRMNVKFDGVYFKQTKLIKPNNDNVINIYCVYSLERITNLRNTDYTVQSALFGGLKVTKDSTDISKHKYEGYGICFDEGGTFSKGGINNGRNVMIFGVHEDSLTHANNKANNIANNHKQIIMGDFIMQGINDTTLYAENIYSQNFTAPNKQFVLSLHYNGDNSYLFVNGKPELKFKAKDDQIVKQILCLGNISDDWTHVNARKTGLYGSVYDFPVDYTKTDIGDIYNKQRYLMKKKKWRKLTSFTNIKC